MADLAGEAGITVRTLRFYRERKLIPPPRREGRIAWYNEHHLARLRTIAGLLERGHTLGGIAELLSAFDTGRDVGELLGLEDTLAAPWSEETLVRLTPEELADHFKDDVTPENLSASLDIGYLAVDGDEFVHISRRLLDASTELVANGVPLSAVLRAGREVRAHADALADLFISVIRTHVLSDVLDRAAAGTPIAPAEIAHITRTVEKLRPISKGIVDAELSMAMDRRVRTELEAWHRERGGPDCGQNREQGPGGPEQDNP
ncbi:MerR family transcriptional regulator [Streptomyces sp. CB02923]|uniref:MerR family transcriptional regulator n=1 Tax=Streptomyces sp. CB02923 TaxID=1718985 RepID=UPI00093E51D8|nr:MerR family transcriptional regulator [Streptomyces sp. CB02923]OKH97841.1 MerR family transcriptional regulator [Streptomyces sp. CB02923]